MVSGNKLLWDFKGLVTAPGRLARAEASCIDANNVVTDAPGVVRKRRAFANLGAVAAGIPWKVFSPRGWGSQVLIARGPTTGSTGLQRGDGTAAWSGVSPPDGAAVRDVSLATRITGAESLRSFYLGARDAPLRLGSDVPSGAGAQYAGMPRGLPIDLTAPFTLLGGAGLLLPDGYARAYRVTWHRIDNDGVVLGGPPTARIVVRNQAGTIGYAAATNANVTIRCPLPMQFGTDATPLTTAFFWRLWGTRTWNAAAGDQGDDEMYLINEQFISPADIAAGVDTYIDGTPDTFLLGAGVPKLNTNSDDFPLGEEGIVQGLLNADDPPPIAYEVASWQNVVWWGDLRYRPQGVLSVLSTGAPNGLQDGDTITVQIGASPITLTARLAPAAPTEFQVYVALATVQMNLEATARAFANVLNQNALAGGIGVRAYTVALPYQQAGDVFIEASRIDATTLGLQLVSSRATWYRWDGTLAGVGVGYGGEARNAAGYSKSLRADAVPPVNRLSAGPNSARLLRMVPFRDKLFWFTDSGLYVVTGRSFADFTINPFALDLTLAARECVCVCDDAVYAWCTQGIVRITDGGWEAISTPIEPTVQELLRNMTSGNGLPELGFAVADTAQHRVLFFNPEGGAAGTINGCSRALVFDTRTAAWSTTRFEILNSNGNREFRSHGCARSSDARVLLTSERDINPNEGVLFRERGIFEFREFVDEGSDGSKTGNVAASLVLQFITPDPGGAMHWQQTVLQFDAGELVWRPIPTALAVAWSTETQSAQTATIVPTTKVLRVEPPRAVRRGNQLAIAIADSSGAYFGLVGVQQLFANPSKWARRTR